MGFGTKSNQRKVKTVITGISKELLLRIIWLRVAFLAFINIGNPKKALRAFLFLDFLRKKYVGNSVSTKGFKANGKYFLYNHVPGFPSIAFDRFHKEELNSIERYNGKAKSLRSAIFSITKRCPLQCEHCYELELLNHKEKLSLDDLKRIIRELQKESVTQIYLSGGEPMARFHDLVELLKSADPGTDFWLVTSGFNLTLDKAKELKQTKHLTGVSISLDHFDESKHNKFRGKSTSYLEAVKAVKNCLEVDLAVGLAICTTKEFTTWNNLMKYATLAKELGVHFIQLQEPYAVGGYQGKDVILDDKHIELLDGFYKELNTNKKYRDYPIVIFHGYHQRRIGCFGGGNKYLYIDSDGYLHSCPYCRTKKANILNESLENGIMHLQEKGCQSFSSIPVNK